MNRRTLGIAILAVILGGAIFPSLTAIFASAQPNHQIPPIQNCPMGFGQRSNQAAYFPQTCRQQAQLASGVTEQGLGSVNCPMMGGQPADYQCPHLREQCQQDMPANCIHADQCPYLRR